MSVPGLSAAIMLTQGRPLHHPPLRGFLSPAPLAAASLGCQGPAVTPQLIREMAEASPIAEQACVLCQETPSLETPWS